MPGPDSPYHPASDIIKARATFSQGSYATPSAYFAKHVIKKILARKPSAYVVAGAKSFSALVSWYLPVWLVDSIKSWLFKLSVLVLAQKRARKNK